MRAWLLLFAIAPTAVCGELEEFFEARVRPIFAANCYTCHTSARMGGLRLDSREALTKGGNSGMVIVPGKPDESVLVQAIRRTHVKLKMPPTGPLSSESVSVVEDWIRRGAAWPETKAPAASHAKTFWSFQPLQTGPVPKVKQAAWVRTPVDAYVLSALEKKGMRPNPPADKRTWIRRVTLDLTGLPPTPEDVEAFVADTAQNASGKVIDRLLASPHYGERWGRHWLDLARYSDGLLAAGVDTPLPNAWRYRDWVVDAFNKDMPYDRFVRAQIAADQMPQDVRADFLPGLGFQAIANNANDQVDVTTKVFLGFTVGCAQCHDHKYDPIPTRDYYSLLGVFRSSQPHQLPLVSDVEVKAYEEQKKKVDAAKELIDEFIVSQQKMLVDVLARHTGRYMMAAWKNQGVGKTGLDEETLKRWMAYLGDRNKEHSFLKGWYEAVDSNSEENVRRAADEFQGFTLQLLDDAKEVDDKNYVAFGGRKGMKDEKTRQYTNIVALPVLKFYQWRELASGPYNIDGFRAPAGVYYYSTKEMERWISGAWREHLNTLRGELKALEAKLPPQYAFLHAFRDTAKPADVKVAIRGDAKTLGEVAPRQFLSALCEGEPLRFTKGSGRLELADAIAKHPLAARVMANRVWQHHFVRGIAATPSNFGAMGEAPTHPELLDHLASRLQESGYSLKALHREILLSNTYRMSSANEGPNAKTDPANKLLWRANSQPRLDLEALRDSVLFVSGKLDRKAGGPAKPIADANHRRSLYLTVSRTRLDGTMSLFDFPDPNATAEERPVTIGPLQGLFFLNSAFIDGQSKALAERLEKEAGAQADARIARAYALLYGRAPDAEEKRLGIEYVSGGEKAWRQYLQTLLVSAEFTSVR
ncbi:MAG: PSD1 domain-containing protein [Candidatus Solibacter usitatus]|nr:PSD1 domain-containing protein [Candidatus Solibacter usitatus]